MSVTHDTLESAMRAVAEADSPGEAVVADPAGAIHGRLPLLRERHPRLEFVPTVRSTEPAVLVRRAVRLAGRFAERGRVVGARRWFPDGEVIGCVTMAGDGRHGVWTRGGFEPLTPGDWVIVYPDGEAAVVPDGRFAAGYEFVGEARP